MMDQLEQGQQQWQEQQDAGAAGATRSSRESRGQSAVAGNGLTNGEAIVVNMSRLADVLGKLSVFQVVRVSCPAAGCSEQ